MFKNLITEINTKELEMIVETCRQYQKDKQCIVDASLLN